MDLLLAMGAHSMQFLGYSLLVTYLCTLKPKKQPFATGTSVDSPVIDPKKELRNYKVGVFIGGITAFILTWWLAVLVLVKITFLVAGIALGFLVAVVRFNHWNDVLAHQHHLLLKSSQPSEHSPDSKSGASRDFHPSTQVLVPKYSGQH